MEQFLYLYQQKPPLISIGDKLTTEEPGAVSKNPIGLAVYGDAFAALAEAKT